MPFPFVLPTTSSVDLSSFFTSSSHPLLILTGTSKRSIVKDALKKHKRLPPQAREHHLSIVQDALTSYLPYLLTISTATGLRDVGSERVDVAILRPLEVEWRTTLSASIPGREVTRPKLTGLHLEVAFTLSTLAAVRSLLARAQLRSLYGTSTLSPEQRTVAITTSMKYFLNAHAVYAYLLSLPATTAAQDVPADVKYSTIAALASLSLTEATLVVVAKDDPYITAVADDRNEDNKEWMYKSPTIPKVRAHLFARFCLAAADHTDSACSQLRSIGSSKLDADLVDYANDLRRTARGKAQRFLAIDSELSGKTGEALAWLQSARNELGLPVKLEDGKRKGLRGLKQSWQERREDKKIEKSGEWGLDGGKFEEARVVEMLETKWEKENDAVNTQIVPPLGPLLSSMPSAREYHSMQTLPVFDPPALDPGTLVQMRAPPDPTRSIFYGEEVDSGDDEQNRKDEPPGAFPSGSADGRQSVASTTYY